MCLSTVYKNSKEPDSILMKNVMEIRCEENQVILVDLMGRELTIEGVLQQANLVDGFVIVKENIPA